ncbi:histidine phosphatase family protein [Bacillus tuaregi]|uniref:histidine phosphatase family protein n=1 Tax=Bacillus tuaregi TaxID=1816695 RepID=UPI0008F7EE56|nr:histidine phosphatase family protein [Bacillus tuaregi]
MDDAVVVALFRHGLTEENRRKAYIGWTDSPICEDVKEALAGNCFQPSPYERIVTSDLQRCLQTAQILFPEQKTTAFPEFRELHFGEWEGKTYAELTGDRYYEKWLSNQYEMIPPQGESYSVFAKRVDEGWRRVLSMMKEDNIQRLAIVTHGGVIRYFLSKLYEKRDFWEWKVPHGNGFELVWSQEEAFRRGERCTLLRAVPLMENQNG